MKTKVIMIASSKGGVGKSTAALGIARQLAFAGESVLLCDLDFGNACLDILLGLEDRVIYTVSDIASGRCKAGDAVIGDGDTGVPGLSLIPCPAGGNVNISKFGEGSSLAASAVVRAAKAAAKEAEASFVIVDTGAGVNPVTDAAAGWADTVLVVASHNPISLRAAEGTVARMNEKGIKDIRLVVNSFEAEATIKRRGSRKGLLDIIDMSRAPLAGVVPYDYSLMLFHEGLSVKESREADAAFRNIAHRLMGEDVPIFEGINKIRKRRKKLYQ